jgi:hypothetical protein
MQRYDLLVQRFPLRELGLSHPCPSADIRQLPQLLLPLRGVAPEHALYALAPA